MLMAPRIQKAKMSVLQYSPHPAAFYTVEVNGQRVGLGADACATDPGLWNIVYLTLAQVDVHETDETNPKKISAWTPEFIKPFTDTAAYELSGTAIGDLATMLHAKGFVAYLMTHPDVKNIPLVVKYGMGIIATMHQRAANAVNLNAGEVSKPIGAIVYEPADVNREKITSMGDWAASLVNGAKH